MYGDHHGYGDDDEGPRLKERLTDACYKFIDIFCVWDCCWAYIRLSEVRLNVIHYGRCTVAETPSGVGSLRFLANSFGVVKNSRGTPEVVF
jgi:hypothetical protein